MFCRSSLHGLVMLETSMRLVALDTIAKSESFLSLIQEVTHNLNLILTTACQTAHVKYFWQGWVICYNQLKKPDFFKKPGFYAFSQKSNQH